MIECREKTGSYSRSHEKGVQTLSSSSVIVFKGNSDSGTYSIFRMKILLPGNIIVSNVCDTHLYLSRETLSGVGLGY